jgi:molecular chaperone DnaK (HSP70)
MRTLITILTLGIIFAALGSETNRTMVVEDNTPIVGADHLTTEAVYVGYRDGLHAFVSKHDHVPSSSTGRATATTTLHLYRGSNPEAARSHSLGDFQIVGIKTVPKEVSLIEFTVAVTEHQILLSASDLTNKTQYEIQRISGGTKP